MLEDDGTSYARGKLHIVQNSLANNSDATAAHSVVTFGNDGNVGIGITTPAEKLDVVGNVKITGALTLSSGVSNSTSIVIKNSSGTALKTMYGTTS
jgi:hypothetical protein